jgi:hypothetical protein
MRTGIAVRRLAVVSVLSGAVIGLAACGTPPPSLTFHPASIPPATSGPSSGVPSSAGPSSTVPSGTVSSGTVSPSASSTAGAVPAASGSPAALFPDARHAAMAFRGTYRAQLLVISASGSLSQDLGAIHAYTWHVAPACGGACVQATSTSHATFTLTYKNGEFDGTGGGISHCLDSSGKDTGAGFRTTLKVTLLPATAAAPVTDLAGIEVLSVSSGCSGATGPGTEVVQYALHRTGS